MKEDDRAEESGDRPEEIALTSDAVKQRLVDFREEALDCKHDACDIDDDVIARSAGWMEHWESNPDATHRRILLERVGHEFMKVHEAPPPDLYVVEMPEGSLGRYRDEDFRIEINKELLDRDAPRAALETYLHEYRHSEAHYEVQKSHGGLRHSVDLERAITSEYNFEHYVSPDADEAVYRRQFVEADAERFGVGAAERILEKLREKRTATGPGGRD